MTQHMRMIAITAALLLSTAAPTSALDVSVGGGSGGVSASAGTGGTSGSVSVGGGDGNVASASTTGGGTSTSGSITTNSGSLASASSDGSSTSGSVNLGGLVEGGGNGDGSDLGGLFPGIFDDNGGTTSNASAIVGTAYAQLSGGEQMLLQNKCRRVMAFPGRYSTDLVSLCRLIAAMR